MRAGCGMSEHENATEAVLQAVDDAMLGGDLNRPDAAFLFATHPHAEELGALGESLTEICGVETVVGASGTGVLTTAGEVEGRPAVAVLLVETDAIRFQAFGVEGTFGRERDVALKLGAKLGASKPEFDPDQERLMVLFPDSQAFNPVDFFPALERGFDGIRAVGGGATSLFGTAASVRGNQQISGGLSGMLMEGQFSSKIQLLSSVRMVGRRLKITRCLEHLVYELDGLPALAVFQGLAQRLLGVEPARAAQSILVALHPSGAGSDESVIRNVVGFDPSRQVLALSQPMVPGDELTFCVLDPRESRQRMSDTFEELSRLEPGFALYFNCAGRGQGFYGEGGVDTTEFRKSFGDLPMAGFFSGAEIAPCAGRNSIHFYTGVLTLVSTA